MYAQMVKTDTKGIPSADEMTPAEQAFLDGGGFKG